MARSGKPRAGLIDRRALLQRARRSPIRPRSSRAEDSARNVSAAKADGRLEAVSARECMAVSIQERLFACKGMRPQSFTHFATMRAIAGPNISRNRSRIACSAMMKDRFTFCDAAATMATVSMPPGLVAR